MSKLQKLGALGKQVSARVACVLRARRVAPQYARRRGVAAAVLPLASAAARQCPQHSLVKIMGERVLESSWVPDVR